VSESSADPPGGEPRRNPWWIPPFLGRAPALPPRLIDMLGVIGLALLFENYDQSMLTAALKHIALDFGVPESELGRVLGSVHFGAMAAFLLVPFADQIGRRRLFLISLLGVSLATVATGFSQTVDQFIAAQMLARTFMVTCAATAFVIITEEFPAAHRGWGIGILGALGAFGHGVGLLLFAAIDVLPYGWRALYMVGALPLLMLPWFRRRVTETARFDRHVRQRAARDDRPGWIAGWLEPLVALVREHPWRTVAIGVIGSLGSAGHAVGFQFSAFHVQTVHDWSPGQYTMMAVVAGLFGVVGNPYAGKVADRRGRRVVGFAVLAGFSLSALAFYHAPGWLLPLIWIPMVFTITGGNTIVRALSTELFPTSFRGTASGWLQLVEAAGRSSGLFLVYWGTPAGGSNVPMISIVVFCALLAGLVVLALPETGQRELEEISSDPASHPSVEVDPTPDPIG